MNDHLILPDSQGSLRADAMQNRVLLIDTARRLFSINGVEAVSMSQIAREANVGKGTLYRHFENKIDLCQALLDESQRQLQENTFKRLRENCPPVEKLEWFLLEVANFVLDYLDLLTAGESADSHALLTHPAHIWWRDTIYGLLSQINLPARLNYVTDVLYVMIAPPTLSFQVNAMGYDREQIADGLSHTLHTLIPV